MLSIHVGVQLRAATQPLDVRLVAWLERDIGVDARYKLFKARKSCVLNAVAVHDESMRSTPALVLPCLEREARVWVIEHDDGRSTCFAKRLDHSDKVTHNVLCVHVSVEEALRQERRVAGVRRLVVLL